MVRVEEIDGRVTAIILSDFVTCWLVRDTRTILIDTGRPADVGDLIAGLRALALKPEDLDFLALTHIHMDHAGGTGHLARANPNLKVFVHRIGVRHVLDPSILMANIRKAYGGDDSVIGEIFGVPAEDMIVPVGTGDRIDLGGTSLEVYETPGHARHHVVYFDRASDAVFSGDALGSFYPGHPSFVLAPPPDYDREVAKKTIDFIKSLNPHRINFTHCGPRVLEDKAFYEKLKEKHDLWNERILEIARERQDADYEWIFEQFLRRVPEVADYPDQFFSFRLSVKGILTYLKRSGKI